MMLKEGISGKLSRLRRKTFAVLKEAKLRGGIISLEGEIKELYESAGMSLFSMWERDDVDIGKLGKDFESIRRKKDEIAEKKERIGRIRAQGKVTGGRENDGPSGESYYEAPAVVEKDAVGAKVPAGAEKDAAGAKAPAGAEKDAADAKPPAPNHTGGGDGLPAETKDGGANTFAGQVVIEEEDTETNLPGGHGGILWRR